MPEDLRAPLRESADNTRAEARYLFGHLNETARPARDFAAGFDTYCTGETLANEPKQFLPLSALLRRYNVNVYIKEFNYLLKRANIEEISPGDYALVPMVDYQRDIGLLVAENCHDPEQFSML